MSGLCLVEIVMQYLQFSSVQDGTCVLKKPIFVLHPVTQKFPLTVPPFLWGSTSWHISTSELFFFFQNCGYNVKKKKKVKLKQT